MAETQTFDTIPILPLSRALDPATKPKFLEDLRHALLNVGFLYLSETGLPDQLIKDVIRECQGFFKELPQEEKERIEMKNEKSFLGWSRVSDQFQTIMIADGAMFVSESVKAQCNRSMAMLERRNIMGGLSLCWRRTRLLDDADVT
jgi:isopenicillin N synthase-like dioxygenase